MNSHSRNNSVEMLYAYQQQPPQAMGSPSMGQQQHRKTMSYNEIHKRQTVTATAAAMNHHHQQQHHRLPSYPNQYQQQPPTTQAQQPYMLAHHGKKPSLADFDPLSGNTPSSTRRGFHAAASPMGRDASPTTGDASARAMDQQRQSVTPPSAGRPLVKAANLDNTMVSQMTNFERFTNENTKNGKNPMAKHVNKFLRKAVKDVKNNLSLGVSQHKDSPKEKNRKKQQLQDTTKNVVNTTAPISPVATQPLALPTPQAPAGAQTEPSTVAAAIMSPNTTMAEDLMELKDQFGHLRIPSLSATNIAPTSFLTGTGSEAVTTSNEPTPFQLEIPDLGEAVTTARLNEFVENYRGHDQNLDLSRFVGLTRMQLQHQINASMSIHNHQQLNSNSGSTLMREHVPIVQSLLDCAQNGSEISIQGYVVEPGDLPADSRAEAVVFQGQRNFTVVFRGTNEQQAKVLGSSKSKKRAVPLDDSKKSANLEVYSGFLETYSKIESQCLQLVDKLVDENPFCDVTFSGYSFGAAMATLAALRYSTSRPMMRVGCLTLASPKVGFSHFRQVVHATPNLRVVRLELGSYAEAKCQGPTVGGWHVGHTLVLNSSNLHNNNANANSNNTGSRSGSPTNSGNNSPNNSGGAAVSSEKKQPSVSVYKFETPKQNNVTAATAFFKNNNPGLKKYISILEDLATVQNHQRQTKKSLSSSTVWPRDFANNAGQGVVVNNEKRLVV